MPHCRRDRTRVGVVQARPVRAEIVGGRLQLPGEGKCHSEKLASLHSFLNLFSANGHHLDNVYSVISLHSLCELHDNHVVM